VVLPGYRCGVSVSGGAQYVSAARLGCGMVLCCNRHHYPAVYPPGEADHLLWCNSVSRCYFLAQPVDGDDGAVSTAHVPTPCPPAQNE